MRETKRQLLHIAVGLVLVWLIHIEVLNPINMTVLLVIGFLLSLLQQKVNIPGITMLLKHMERPDKKILPGGSTLHYLAGATFVLLLFPKQIALAALMILTLGDSCSHLAGKYLGFTKNPFNQQKLIEGTVAGIFVGALGAAFFVPFFKAFTAATIAMLVEAVEIKIWRKPLDDNLIIPLLAGFVLWTIRMV